MVRWLMTRIHRTVNEVVVVLLWLCCCSADSFKLKESCARETSFLYEKKTAPHSDRKELQNGRTRRRARTSLRQGLTTHPRTK